MNPELVPQDGGLLRPARAPIWFGVGSIAIAVMVMAAGMRTPVGDTVIRVGPTRSLKKPSEAAAIAQDGDVVAIDAGTYVGDVAVWRASHLTVRGVGGSAHLQAAGKSAEGKGIWVIKGNNTVVENIEFSGATVPDQNGAGIRQEGTDLTVRRCYFHENENGILGGRGNVLIEFSEFANNGFGDGQSHNMYISRAGSFTLRYSYSHHAKIGHNVKSRAQTNYILYNRIMDEETGTASYAIDIPNGGDSYIIGNVIQQGPDAENPAMIAYAAEGGTNPLQEIFVVNNTLVNDRSNGGTFVRIFGTPTVRLVNNVFAGMGTVLSGQGKLSNNLISVDPKLADPVNFDYRPTPESPVIDAGTDPGPANGFDLTPRFQYVHVASQEKRPVVSTIDIGAFEFIGTPSADRAPPIRANSAPSAGSEVPAKRIASAGDTDDRIVVGKRFILDGMALGAPSGAPVFRAVARDAADDSGSSPHIPVKVGYATTPPELGWSELPNTRLRRVCPPNDFGGSGYDFTSFCDDVTEAWNSGVFDTKRNRLIIWGGGHNGYFGNEIYALNLGSNTIERLTDPGLPLAPMSGCPGPEAIANGTQPNSRHTYDGIAYMEKYDKMFVFGGSKAPCGWASRGTWAFDFETLTWEQKNPTGVIPGGEFGIVTAYDPNTGKVFLHDNWNLYAYDYASDHFDRLAEDNFIGIHMSATLDPVRRKMVIVGRGNVFVYDVGPGSSFDRQSLNTNGASSIVNSVYPGLAYDPGSGHIVAWNGGDTVYSLDLVNGEWNPTTYPRGPGPALPNGTYDRWSYSPSSGVFVVLNSVDDNAYTLRLSDSAVPGGATSAPKPRPTSGPVEAPAEPSVVVERAPHELPGVGLDPGEATANPCETKGTAP